MESSNKTVTSASARTGCPQNAARQAEKRRQSSVGTDSFLKSSLLPTRSQIRSVSPSRTNSDISFEDSADQSILHGIKTKEADKSRLFARVDNKVGFIQKFDGGCLSRERIKTMSNMIEHLTSQLANKEDEILALKGRINFLSIGLNQAKRSSIQAEGHDQLIEENTKNLEIIEKQAKKIKGLELHLDEAVQMWNASEKKLREIYGAFDATLQSSDIEKGSVTIAENEKIAEIEKYQKKLEWRNDINGTLLKHLVQKNALRRAMNKMKAFHTKTKIFSHAVEKTANGMKRNAFAVWRKIVSTNAFYRNVLKRKCLVNWRKYTSRHREVNKKDQLAQRYAIRSSRVKTLVSFLLWHNRTIRIRLGDISARLEIVDAGEKEVKKQEKLPKIVFKLCVSKVFKFWARLAYQIKNSQMKWKRRTFFKFFELTVTSKHISALAYVGNPVDLASYLVGEFSNIYWSYIETLKIDERFSDNSLSKEDCLMIMFNAVKRNQSDKFPELSEIDFDEVNTTEKVKYIFETDNGSDPTDYMKGFAIRFIALQRAEIIIKNSSENKGSNLCGTDGNSIDFTSCSPSFSEKVTSPEAISGAFGAEKMGVVKTSSLRTNILLGEEASSNTTTRAPEISNSPVAMGKTTSRSGGGRILGLGSLFCGSDIWNDGFDFRPSQSEVARTNSSMGAKSNAGGTSVGISNKVESISELTVALGDPSGSFANSSDRIASKPDTGVSSLAAALGGPSGSFANSSDRIASKPDTGVSSLAAALGGPSGSFANSSDRIASKPDTSVSSLAAALGGPSGSFADSSTRIASTLPELIGSLCMHRLFV